MHRPTLAIRDTLTATQEFSDDGADCSATHQSEAVAAVGGDKLVGAGDGVFDTSGDGFLAGRQMAKAPDFLLLVQTVCGHFHAPVGLELYARIAHVHAYLIVTMS